MHIGRAWPVRKFFAPEYPSCGISGKSWKTKGKLNARDLMIMVSISVSTMIFYDLPNIPPKWTLQDSGCWRLKFCFWVFWFFMAKYGNWEDQKLNRRCFIGLAVGYQCIWCFACKYRQAALEMQTFIGSSQVIGKWRALPAFEMQ